MSWEVSYEVGVERRGENGSEGVSQSGAKVCICRANLKGGFIERKH